MTNFLFKTGNIPTILVLIGYLFFASPAFAQGGFSAPEIGSLGRFAMVLVYLVTILRCLYKAQQSKKFGGNYWFWVLLAIYLLFFAVDKLIGLQDLFTDIARNTVEASGEYDQRASVQFAFAGLVAVVVIALGLMFGDYWVNSFRRYKLTWAGILLLSLYMTIRILSLHDFDALIAKSIVGISINAYIQLVLLALIFFGTFGEKKPIGNRRGSDTRSRLVEIARVGDPVHCPSCGLQPLANTKDGRQFKCRKCGHVYAVAVVSHTILSY